MNEYPYQPYYSDQRPEQRKPNRPSWAVCILIALIAAVLGGLIGAFGFGMLEHTLLKQNSKPNEEITQLRKELNSLEKTVSELPKTADAGVIERDVDTVEFSSAVTRVVEEVGPAVVTVTTVIPGQMSYWGVRYADSTSMGSGVIISEEGYILTNNHVIADGKSFSVELSTGEVREARLVGSDSFSDIAILKVEGTMPAVAKLGNSDLLKAGETAIAIGSPLGNFKNTVTVGVISATGRFLESGSQEGYTMENLIQTDAAINQGNSGGPLVNLAGEVIGINVMIVRGSGTSSATAEGLGFAIPSNTASLIGEQLVEKGSFSRPVLGIRWVEITARMARYYNLPTQYGVYVMDVVSGGPAARAGLQKNDIIVRIGDYTVEETGSFYNTIFKYSPGDTVEVEFYRNNRLQTVTVTLGGEESEQIIS